MITGYIQPIRSKNLAALVATDLLVTFWGSLHSFSWILKLHTSSSDKQIIAKVEMLKFIVFHDAIFFCFSEVDWGKSFLSFAADLPTGSPVVQRHSRQIGCEFLWLPYITVSNRFMTRLPNELSHIMRLNDHRLTIVSTPSCIFGPLWSKWIKWSTFHMFFKALNTTLILRDSFLLNTAVLYRPWAI